MKNRNRNKIGKEVLTHNKANHPMMSFLLLLSFTLYAFDTASCYSANSESIHYVNTIANSESTTISPVPTSTVLISSSSNDADIPRMRSTKKPKETLQPSISPTPSITLFPLYKSTTNPTVRMYPSLRPSIHPSIVPSEMPFQFPSMSPSEIIQTQNIQPAMNITATYIPGKLTVVEYGLNLSEGLTANLIAATNFPVRYFPGQFSDAKFLVQPDAAATFPDTRSSNKGGWIYTINSEFRPDRNVTNKKQGGVGAITFDRNGKVIDYRLLLNGTQANCGGGKTPWGVSNLFFIKYITNRTYPTKLMTFFVTLLAFY
jgi:hypothetical protein